MSAFGGKADIMPGRGEGQKFKFRGPQPPGEFCARIFKKNN